MSKDSAVMKDLAMTLLWKSMWDLPRPGIKPMSPAWAGTFFTTESPRKLPEDTRIPIQARDNGTLQHRGCKRGGEKLWNFRNILKFQITGFHSG